MEMELEKLSEFVLECKSQIEMAQQLGISQLRFSQDLQKLVQRWQKAIGNTDIYKARKAPNSKPAENSPDLNLALIGTKKQPFWPGALGDFSRKPICHLHLWSMSSRNNRDLRGW